MLYLLWDLKLKVGHATRSIKEALALAREDMTIRTALLEMRHLAGDEALTRDLRARYWAEVARSSSLAFLEGYYYKPRMDWDLLSRHSGGLIATTRFGAVHAERVRGPLLLGGAAGHGRSSATRASRNQPWPRVSLPPSWR